MTNLMNELKRFEQEMKELASETSQLFTPPLPSHVKTQGHLPTPPPPPQYHVSLDFSSTIFLNFVCCDFIYF